MAHIKTYARLKPTKKPYNGYVISKNVLTMHIPDNKDFVILGPQNNLRSNFSYDIIFTNIFGCDAPQEEVFDGVAKDIIHNFLNGYNGTIFAYGQTGTGKTYTVEGNTSRYSARGLATRALSMIYQELEKRSDQHISVYLSYLEIYQEVAYDLLNPAARSTIPIAPFARVTVVEGPRGSCILRGLSLHLAANEEIAQMLLLQGQANRKVAETPVNQRSSRSHAVFTVYLQVRKHDSDVLVNSKLHLVDLAGSERVSKTGVDGQQLTEAKSINLSLHHLETVIIALQLDKPTSASSKGENPPHQSRSSSSLMSSGPSSDNGGSRQLRFVPYRNSLLTMVLKDSLGGNCLTAMIATISLEPDNLGESISTCRFAQRVARIANNARRNEEVDDKAMIKRLKNKVAYLENQVALLRSKGRTDPVTDQEIMDVLTDEDHRICQRIMEGFLQGIITDPVEAGISDHCKFRACLQLLKHQFLQRSLTSSSLASSTSAGPSRHQHHQAALLPGTSASTGTLLPRPSCSRADLLVGGAGVASGAHVRPANNPQQDSGDYAAVIHHSQGHGQLLELANGAKQSEGPVESREQSRYDNHEVRTSKPLQDGVGSLQAGHQGVEAEIGGGGHDNSQAAYLGLEVSGSGQRAGGGSHRKNNSVKAKAVNEVIQACNGGGGGSAGSSYKSPYERRREKEIRRLSRKLSEMEDDKADRENYLQQMKEQAIVEELLVAETGLRLKLQVAEEQVADQHAYLLQLKHLQADPDLIAKEQLVEKQLRKRQAKFHDKLTKVLASKENLDKDFAARHQQSSSSSAAAAASMSGEGQHLQQQLQQQPSTVSTSAATPGTKQSVEDQFGQYKQGKGSLNTRQVFDLLKNQEKKQQKESQKVERETALVKTKQLAIKEAATLEKLRELKQMLKLSLIKEDQRQQHQQKHPPHDNIHFGKHEDSEEADAAAALHQNFATTYQEVEGAEQEPTSYSQGLQGTSVSHSSKSGNASSSHRGGRRGGQHSHAGQSPLSTSGRDGRSHTWAQSFDQNQSQRSSSITDGGITVEKSRSVQQFMAEMIGGGSGPQTPLQQDSSRSSNQAFSHHDLSYSAPCSRIDTVLGEASSSGSVAGPGVEGSSQSATDAMGSKSVHDPRHSLKFFEEGQGVGSSDSPSLALTHKPERFTSSRRATAEHMDANANNVSGMSVSEPAGNGELLLSDLETAPPAVAGSSTGEAPGQSHGEEKNSINDNPATVSASSLLPSQASHRHSNNHLVNHHSSPLAQTSLLALQQQQQQQHSVPVVPPSEYINNMSTQDQFDARRMGLSSRTFESALSHMLDWDNCQGGTTGGRTGNVDEGDMGNMMRRSNVPDLPYSVDPYEGFSRSPRQSRHQGLTGQSLSESPYQQRNPRPQHPPRRHGQASSVSPNRRAPLNRERRTGVDTNGQLASAWGPESKNASVADRLANLLETPSKLFPVQNQSGVQSATAATSYSNRVGKKEKTSMDAFQSKLAEFRHQPPGDRVTVEDMDGDSDAGSSINNKALGEKCDEEEEERSFFGLQPAQTKLTAMTAEEGERTFLSAVAAEKARVEKIRRARNAAEVIQRGWRNFRTQH